MIHSYSRHFAKADIPIVSKEVEDEYTLTFWDMPFDFSILCYSNSVVAMCIVCISPCLHKDDFRQKRRHLSLFRPLVYTHMMKTHLKTENGDLI